MKRPEVIREKAARLTEERVACALVLDRDLTADEIARFRAVPADDEPRPERFQFQERIVRYECEVADTPRWRLAFEIFLAKAFAPTSMPPEPGPARPTADTRTRAGLRKLHIG